jgi:uncharacterized protein (DUF433 family)
MIASYRKRIIVDNKIMRGKPVIKGTRITVELILRKLGQGANFDDLIMMYPHLVKEDILAAILSMVHIVLLLLNEKGQTLYNKFTVITIDKIRIRNLLS